MDVLASILWNELICYPDTTAGCSPTFNLLVLGRWVSRCLCWCSLVCVFPLTLIGCLMVDNGVGVYGYQDDAWYASVYNVTAEFHRDLTVITLPAVVLVHSLGWLFFVESMIICLGFTVGYDRVALWYWWINASDGTDTLASMTTVCKNQRFDPTVRTYVICRWREFHLRYIELYHPTDWWTLYHRDVTQYTTQRKRSKPGCSTADRCSARWWYTKADEGGDDDNVWY